MMWDDIKSTIRAGLNHYRCLRKARMYPGTESGLDSIAAIKYSLTLEPDEGNDFLYAWTLGDLKEWPVYNTFRRAYDAN